jgi:hypothetical protein
MQISDLRDFLDRQKKSGVTNVMPKPSLIGTELAACPVGVAVALVLEGERWSPPASHRDGPFATMPAIVSVRNVPIVLEVWNSFCVLIFGVFKEKHRVVPVGGMAVRLIYGRCRSAMMRTIRINRRRQNCRKSDGCRENLHVMPPVLRSEKARAPGNKETQPNPIYSSGLAFLRPSHVDVIIKTAGFTGC